MAEDPVVHLRRKVRGTGTFVYLERFAKDHSDGPWATICEDHGGIVHHATRKLAEQWLPYPEDWCSTCQEQQNVDKGETAVATQPHLQLSPKVRKKLKELNLTADEVIRKELGIQAEGFSAGRGVLLPEGTRFLWWFKDEPYGGTVKDGFLVVKGIRYTSVSAAAASITGRPTTNGWSYWDVQIPGDKEYRPIASYRQGGQA